MVVLCPLGIGIANNEDGLRGAAAGRKLDDHYDETKFCNSIGCPNGFQPIENAWEIECYDGVCETDQCCQAFCSSFSCPTGMIPITSAPDIKCDDNVCSTEQCCWAFCSYRPFRNGYNSHRERRQRALRRSRVHHRAVLRPGPLLNRHIISSNNNNDWAAHPSCTSWGSRGWVSWASAQKRVRRKSKIKRSTCRSMFRLAQRHNIY